MTVSDRVTEFWRGVVLTPDDGIETFLVLNVVPHDETQASPRIDP